MIGAQGIIACFVLIASLLNVTEAKADIVERIVATVNDKAIFLSELRKRATPFLPTVAEASTETERMARLQQLYEELLSNLIDDELLGQLAKQSKITVSPQDVDDFVENIRAQNKLTQEQFREAIRNQGMTEEQYREDLKRQILRFKVTNERVRNRINITEKEVRRRYEQQARKKGNLLRFQVSHITVPIEDVHSATQVASARQKAEQLAATLTPENFDEKTKQSGGGNMGWVAQKDLAPELESALIQTDEGHITPPIHAGRFFHIFLVNKREIGSDFPRYEEIHETLAQQMFEAALTRQEQIFLDELRRKAVINRML